jgi:FAD-dependent urate hydroxylase
VRKTQLLIIGAGPYGLATAASAQRAGIEFRLLGRRMSFWKRNMPAGMLLRSGRNWHMDPCGECTFLQFLKEQGGEEDRPGPIAVEQFIEYGDWFQKKKKLAVEALRVVQLGVEDGVLVARLDNGERLAAENVVAAPGFKPFTVVPETFSQALPSHRYSHTCALVNFDHLRGRRCLIVGGRQSAFEWAALMHERGAAEIDVVYRHATPEFCQSDWDWIEPMLESTLKVPGWFRRLPATEQKGIADRFWAEGRLKLEPWLGPRIRKPTIRLRPGTQVVACREEGGAVLARLDNGEELTVDLVVLATGYRVDMRRVPYLAQLLPRLEVADGFPVLDEHFQSSVPGLFLPGLTAARDFGPFFGFVRGAPVAATLIANRIASR